MFPTSSFEIMGFKPKKIAKFSILLCFKVSYNMDIADIVMSSCSKVPLCLGYNLLNLVQIG